MQYTHEIVMALAEKYCHGDIDWANDYGEPGYSTDKRCILFSNWNNWPRHVQNALKKQYELEWSDEWRILHNNGSSAYRISPDCYSWTCSIHYLESAGDYVPVEETGDYLEEYTNNARMHYAGPLEALTETGFIEQSERYETGFHPGQNDSPEKILKQYQDTHDVVFTVTDKGQFDVTWTVWLRKHD